MVDIWKPGDPVPEDVKKFHFVSWITDQIAIGPYVLAADPDILDIERIQNIVSIGQLSPNYDDREVVQVEVEDGTSQVAKEDIIRVVDAINRLSSKGKTLVHCAAGVSRSPAFVAVHLALLHKWDWEMAIAFVKSKREQANVHPALESRLKDYLAGI